MLISSFVVVLDVAFRWKDLSGWYLFVDKGHGRSYVDRAHYSTYRRETSFVVPRKIELACWK